MILEGAVNGPIILTDDEGTKIRFCRCGLTKNSPYCDDSHYAYRRGMTPFTVEFDRIPEVDDYEDITLIFSPLEEEDQEEEHQCNCASCVCNDAGCECQDRLY